MFSRVHRLSESMSKSFEAVLEACGEDHLTEIITTFLSFIIYSICKLEKTAPMPMEVILCSLLINYISNHVKYYKLI